MSKFYKRFKSYTKASFQVFIFTLTAIALYFILPSEPKFKYEYQKGFPWQHENLVAPFNFAIQKTTEEMEKEKEVLLNSVVPYFEHDTSSLSKGINLLKEDLGITPDSITEKKELAFQVLKQALKQLDSIGILQFSPNTYDELKNTDEIKKRTGQVVTKIKKEKLYSEKTAYNFMNNVCQKLIEKDNEMNWLSSLMLEKYIVANLSLDEKTTQKEALELTQNLSSTHGMVKLGERIILKGEVVDKTKFQLLESLKASYEKEYGKNINRYLIGIGKALFITILLGLIFAFLFLYKQDVLNKINKLSFLLILMVGIALLSFFVGSFPNLHIYIFPFAVFPIVVRTFFNSRTAIFMLIISSILIGFYAPNNYEFILLQLAAGTVAVFSLNRMHRRVHLVLASLWVFLSYMTVYVALTLIHEGTLTNESLSMAKWFAFSSFLILLIYPLVYIFEKLFGFISDVTLIEISDSNQPLLRKLAEEAPGTFQHSMQIANLAEEVILKIGGNPFLVRAGSLYHDIGKIGRPNFFIENQAVGMNPHDRLSNIKSAQIIIEHVNNGIKMAHKHKLPEPIIEFIATHHGTTKANYFFLKHVQDNPNELVDENAFIYPGPLPKSKEATVVMLVDGIEAASRSMKEKTHDNLKSLINKIIDKKIEDKQLEDSELMFKDIAIIKSTLLDKLLNIYHVRIEYPEDKKE